MDWNQSPSQLQQSCVAHLYRLYNPNNAFPKRKKSKRSANAIPDKLDDKIAQDSRKQRQRTWTISIRVSKFDLPHEFIIRAFMGPPSPSADPTKWYAEPGHVGSVYVNQPPNVDGYYDGKDRDVVVYDEFDIQEVLWDRGGGDGQDVEETIKFLGGKGGLRWVVHSVSLFFFFSLSCFPPRKT